MRVYQIQIIFLELLIIVLIDMRSIRKAGKISGLNLREPESQKNYNCKKAENIQYTLNYISIIGILVMMGLDYLFQWTLYFPVRCYLILACFVAIVFLPIAKTASRNRKDA